MNVPSLTNLPKIEAPYTLFLSDIHLSADTVELNQVFSSLLASDLFTQAEAFYLLGDLFDFWLGDDMLDDPAYEAIADDIFALSCTGVPCYFQEGNRDFLIGERFASETGMTLINDPHVIDLYGKRTLLSHGDRFCTKDVAYQKFRQQTRGKLREELFLLLPKRTRNLIFEYTRSSIKKEKIKDPSLLDVDPITVDTFAAQYMAAQVIHGHTHLPMQYSESYGGRYVISDWRQTDKQITAGILVASPQGIHNIPTVVDLPL